MVKVITYGTYDLLHFGHIRLLQRAKALGDYLIVGVTADDYDKTRGKINVSQSLMERIENVRATGLADEIIIEEYEGQKIDDIKKHNVDIFTVGTDWQGKFDYLNEYCKVVYLERTVGVSSSELRAHDRALTLGIVGDENRKTKLLKECSFVNGIEVLATDSEVDAKDLKIKPDVVSNLDEMLDKVDAVYIVSNPKEHYLQIKKALSKGKHVLCESPIALTEKECDELFDLADSKNLVLMDAIKTAYSTAYFRLVLLIKSGKIGDVISVDSTCTSLVDIDFSDEKALINNWNSLCEWGPTALLPIFQILGTDYINAERISLFEGDNKEFDRFSKISFTYKDAVASIKVGNGAKSEGQLIISGTKGYVYVPAPWWKTDYFEIRYENQNNNKRHFYQLDGEGIRNEVLSFVKATLQKDYNFAIDRNISKKICALCGGKTYKEIIPN